MSLSLRTKRVIALLVAGATVGGAVIAYLSYKQQQCSALFSSGLLAFNNQNWSFASSSLGSYLECEPRDQQALHMVIESRYQAMDFSGMRHWLYLDLERFPGDPVPRYWSAVLLIVEDNDFQRALPILEEVHFEVEESHPKVNMFLAMALIESGQINEGCSSLKYYIDSPHEKDNVIRRTAVELYSAACSEEAPK